MDTQTPERDRLIQEAHACFSLRLVAEAEKGVDKYIATFGEDATADGVGPIF